ncbi:MAG: hypothetical protein KIPDCIKN_02867 [Haliscomenobacter sp.]|jgi:predicted site-specific integrase-resolvase|nr:hypothetical protein [Haliscomenobacter sp.]
MEQKPFPRTKKELAKCLGISMSTLKRWLKKKELTVPRGLIPPIKVKEILKKLGYEEEP